MLGYICRYILGGEITGAGSNSEDGESQFQSKFHILPQYGKKITQIIQFKITNLLQIQIH